jgi:signal recognition particle subunit SRP54
MMKRMNKLGQKGLMRGGLGALLPGMGGAGPGGRGGRRPF